MGKNDEEKSSGIWEHDYRMIIQISTRENVYLLYKYRKVHLIWVFFFFNQSDCR